jgi:hypothetical protein
MVRGAVWDSANALILLPVCCVQVNCSCCLLCCVVVGDVVSLVVVLCAVLCCAAAADDEEVLHAYDEITMLVDGPGCPIMIPTVD